MRGLFLALLLASSCNGTAASDSTWTTPRAVAPQIVESPVAVPAETDEFSIRFIRHVSFVPIGKGCYRKRTTWIATDEAYSYVELQEQAQQYSPSGYVGPDGVRHTPDPIPTVWTSAEESTAAAALADYLRYEAARHGAAR